MEYVQAVNGVLLYGNILMQSCGEDNDKKTRVLETINSVLNEMSDRVICQKMTLTDNSFNMSMQKLINIK
jgi:hypothetical protein